MPTLAEIRPNVRGIGKLVKNFPGTDWMIDSAKNQSFRAYVSINPDGGEAILGVLLRNENFPINGRNIIDMTIQYPDGDLTGIKDDKFYAFYFEGRTQYLLEYRVDEDNPALAFLAKVEKGGVVSGPYKLVGEEEKRKLDLPGHGFPAKVNWVNTAMMYLLGHHPDDESQVVSLEQMKRNLLLPAKTVEPKRPRSSGILVIGAEPTGPTLGDYLDYLSALGPEELKIVRERLNQLTQHAEFAPGIEIRSNPVEDIYLAIIEGMDRESKNPGSIWGLHEWLVEQIRVVRAENASSLDSALANVKRLRDQGNLQSEYTVIKAPTSEEVKSGKRYEKEYQERMEVLWLLESLGAIEEVSERLQNRLPQGAENEVLIRMLTKSGGLRVEIIPAEGESPSIRSYRKSTRLEGVEVVVRIAGSNFPNHNLNDGLAVVDSISLVLTPELFVYLAEKYQEPGNIYEYFEILSKRKKRIDLGDKLR